MNERAYSPPMASGSVGAKPVSSINGALRYITVVMMRNLLHRLTNNGAVSEKRPPARHPSAKAQYWPPIHATNPPQTQGSPLPTDCPMPLRQARESYSAQTRQHAAFPSYSPSKAAGSSPSRP